MSVYSLAFDDDFYRSPDGTMPSQNKKKYLILINRTQFNLMSSFALYRCPADFLIVILSLLLWLFDFNQKL